MNVLQKLDTEMKGKNWSLEEKKRYLYLQSCKLFTYDTRHYFVSSDWGQRNIKNASSILNSIDSKVIDLTNVTDPRVNCYSWSNGYQQILKKLLNIDAKVAYNMFGNHAWLIFGHKADATVDSDLTRVKMNLCTLGYELSTCENSFMYDLESPKKIKLMDKNIHYIEDNYCNFTLLVEQLKLEFKNLHVKENEALFWWMNHLRDTYQHFKKNLIYFEDASFCISYLINYFIPNYIRNKTTRVTLFDDTNDFWNFIDIYQIIYLGNIFYYALIKIENGYDFIEISYSDVVNYISSLKGPEKELLLNR